MEISLHVVEVQCTIDSAQVAYGYQSKNAIHDNENTKFSSY